MPPFSRSKSKPMKQQAEHCLPGLLINTDNRDSIFL
jgi:hypothetical protein